MKCTNFVKSQYSARSRKIVTPKVVGNYNRITLELSDNQTGNTLFIEFDNEKERIDFAVSLLKGCDINRIDLLKKYVNDVINSMVTWSYMTNNKRL